MARTKQTAKRSTVVSIPKNNNNNDILPITLRIKNAYKKTSTNTNIDALKSLYKPRSKAVEVPNNEPKAKPKTKARPKAKPRPKAQPKEPEEVGRAVTYRGVRKNKRGEIPTFSAVSTTNKNGKEVVRKIYDPI